MRTGMKIILIVGALMIVGVLIQLIKAGSGDSSNSPGVGGPLGIILLFAMIAGIRAIWSNMMKITYLILIRMNRFFTFILILVCLSFSGCNKPSEPSPTVKSNITVIVSAYYHAAPYDFRATINLNGNFYQLLYFVNQSHYIIQGGNLTKEISVVSVSKNDIINTKVSITNIVKINKSDSISSILYGNTNISVFNCMDSIITKYYKGSYASNFPIPPDSNLLFKTSNLINNFTVSY